MPKPATPPPPQDHSIRHRKRVRDVLKALPPSIPGLSFPALHEQIRASYDPSAAEADVQAALEWNFKQGHINFEFIHELETDIWSLTTRGKNTP